MFSNHVGIKESNEVEVLAILEAFRLLIFLLLLSWHVGCGT